MFRRLAQWYANGGKRLILKIELVILYIMLVAYPLSCLAGGISLLANPEKYGKNATSAGVTLLVSIIPIILLAILAIGFCRGEMIIFERINKNLPQEEDPTINKIDK